MEIETLNAMNESRYLNMLTTLEVIAIIYILLAIASFVFYLACVAWLCFEETRQPAPRRMKPAPAPSKSREYESLEVVVRAR